MRRGVTRAGSWRRVLADAVQQCVLGGVERGRSFHLGECDSERACRAEVTLTSSFDLAGPHTAGLPAE